ncbi:hypothetical protein P8452_32436 [Trifolium repens]|nr:hypothetical protein P8452_32436 [Trifolium repens]
MVRCQLDDPHIGGNITRLETLYSSNPSRFNCLYSLIQVEIGSKTAKSSSSCTNGLLLLTRAMDFLVALFRNLIEHDDWPMSQACTDAYNKTLKKLHGWLASSSFTVAMKLAPDRKKFMEVIGGTGDINADTEKFCTAFSPLLVQNHKFLARCSLIGPGGLKFISEMVQLKAVGPVAVLGGLLQIVIFMFLCGILAMLCGGKLSEGVFVGSFLSMSSTTVDCAVGLLFALLPVLGGNSGLLQGIISMGKLLQKRSKGRSCSDRIVVRYWRKEQKARTCVAPLERLKLEYIVRGEKKNIFELIKSIATSQGLRGFWKGNLLNIPRTAPFKAVTLVLTIHIERRFSGNEETTNFERFIAGAAAGDTATIISLPLDTVCGNFHDFRGEGESIVSSHEVESAIPLIACNKEENERQIEIESLVLNIAHSILSPNDE